jgi:Na+-driven multidrug efflux pump
LITSFEQWCSHGLKIISGFLGETNQATMIISFNVTEIIFFVPVCIGFAISALVGAAIGKGDIIAAKKITKVAFIFQTLVLLLIVIVLQFTIRNIINLYT